MRISDWSSDVCSSDLLATNRPLSGRFAEYSEETTSELDIINAAADAHRAYGPQCITVYNISKAESVSDMLEVNILLKEAGLWRTGVDGGPPQAAIMVMRSEEHPSELQSLMRISYAVFCLKKKQQNSKP